MSRRLVVAAAVLVAGFLVAPAAGQQAPAAPPTLDSTPPPRTNSQTATFAFSSTEPSASFECSLDGAAEFTPCESGVVYVDLAEGSHTFAVRAVRPGRPASDPTTYSWTIDITAPVLVLAEPATGTVTDLPTPTFSGTAGTALGDVAEVTVEISLVDGTSSPVVVAADVTEAGIWSVTAPSLPDGTYVAQAKQLDDVGNEATDEMAFVVDTTRPVLWVPREVLAEATSAAGAAVTFDVAAGDILDRAPAIVCDPSSGSTFALAPPSATVVCTATDHAGNSATRSFPVTVRNTIAPPRPRGFAAAAGHRVVVLTWRRPTNWDYDHVVISRARLGGSWTVVATVRTQTSFTDRGVANDRIYRYRIESVDTATNTSAAVELRARPSAFFQPAYLATVRAPVLLRWARVARATYYNVQVWRNGRKILSRWPLAARISLPASWRYAGRVWRLRRGTYTVYAWPGFGPKRAARYGPLRGWTRFVVRS